MAFDFGIKISEAGYDVFTATDKQLIFKSDFQLIKVAFSGTVPLIQNWITITHNLGYIPQFLVFINDSNTNKTCLGTAMWGIGVARADTSKVYIKRNNVSGDTAYYYIFYEQA